MSKWKLLLFAFAICALITSGHAETVKAFHAPNHGYFRGLSEGGGWWDVWEPAWDGWSGAPSDCGGGDGQAIPYGVDTADEFLNFVQCKLNLDWPGRNHVGAAFMLWTMTGTGDFGELVRRVKYAESRGWFQIRTLSCNPSGPLPANTFYQSTQNDVAYYWGCPVVSDYPGGPYYYPASYNAITIYNGSDWYVIARYCANPIGNMPVLADDVQFNLSPSISVLVNGAASTSGSFVEPGDQVTFRYAVANNDGGTSASTACTYRRATHTGYSTAAPSTAFTPSGANCPPDRTFPPWSNTITAEEVITANPANSSLCRSFTVNPTAPSGGSITRQACVHVAAKPYLQVYGGDVSAGGGLATSPGSPNSCSQSARAAIIGWNKRAAGVPAVEQYAGAGVQYAASALSAIFDSATSFGNGAGAAARPAGLSFANIGAVVANGQFGGTFGSVSCIPDYYAAMPAGTTPNLGSSVSANMASGVYYRNGNLQLNAGTISSNRDIVLYVNGNVYISGSIGYSGSWTLANIPSFRVIVRGNIYIGNGVSQLDGLYVAQPSNSSTGVIYTCATGMGAPVVPGGNLGSLCSGKLTVNGSFAARQIQFLRTRGTLRGSIATEGSGSANIAEVFNYGPAFWIPQPTGLAGGEGYDAITSLPPVL
jgi:hypothetical protein